MSSEWRPREPIDCSPLMQVWLFSAVRQCIPGVCVGGDWARREVPLAFAQRVGPRRRRSCRLIHCRCTGCGSSLTRVSGPCGAACTVCTLCSGSGDGSSPVGSAPQPGIGGQACRCCKRQAVSSASALPPSAPTDYPCAGHKVGSDAMTNKLQMAICLHAERRWVMTGVGQGLGGGGGLWPEP